MACSRRRFFRTVGAGAAGMTLGSARKGLPAWPRYTTAKGETLAPSASRA
ncbi:twin-arginine translocation signal domain-containing protein [Luteitalea sp. TBR-22]|nr:twin-arginine translocation signal domain-containing protein [Luteitalea sp. TBR-22]